MPGSGQYGAHHAAPVLGVRGTLGFLQRTLVAEAHVTASILGVRGTLGFVQRSHVAEADGAASVRGVRGTLGFLQRAIIAGYCLSIWGQRCSLRLSSYRPVARGQQCVGERSGYGATQRSPCELEVVEEPQSFCQIVDAFLDSVSVLMSEADVCCSVHLSETSIDEHLVARPVWRAGLVCWLLSGPIVERHGPFAARHL